VLTPTEAYQYDSTFRRVVDLMCAYLSEYEITPAELRQAAILAATMHADRCIKPLYIPIPPAMFGSLDELSRTATGAMFNIEGCTTGRFKSSAPNFTVQDKQDSISRIGATSGGCPSAGWTVTQVDKPSVLDKYECICGAPSWGQAHSHTCKDYNWDVTHPKP
jgi:hypothetical protein